MSTALTIAAGASAATELDVRGFIPLKIHVGAGWTAANLGFKARAWNQSTSRVVYDNTGASGPVQISGINTTVGGCYSVPYINSLIGVSFLTVYRKNLTAATTSAVNQTSAAAVTLYLEGMG